MTSAATRQPAPQQTANPNADAPYASPYAQGNRWDEQAPDTSRFYRPPMTPNYTGYPAAEAKKSNPWKWVLIALLCFLLAGGGIGAMVFSAIRARHRTETLVPSGEEIAAGIRERIEDEVARAMEDAQRAAEEAANGDSPPSPPGSEAPVDLDKYKYPKAAVDNQIRVIGNEILKLRTGDGYEEVKKFYQKLLGEPVIEDNQDDERRLVFQSTARPSVLVTIRLDEEHAGQLQIVIIRSRFQIPRIESR